MENEWPWPSDDDRLFVPRNTIKLLDDIRYATTFILELVRERALADYESIPSFIDRVMVG